MGTNDQNEENEGTEGTKKPNIIRSVQPDKLEAVGTKENTLCFEVNSERL